MVMRLDTSEIIAWIRANCLENDPDRYLSSETLLLDEGLLDSMHILGLVIYLEERTGSAVPLEEVVPENFETPDRIAALACRLGDS